MLPNLKKLRQEYGVSQQKLADALGITQPAVYKYENMDIEPELAILKQMASFFNTSVDYIIGNTDIRRKVEKTEEYALNEDEIRIVGTYRKLSGEQKECMEHVMQVFLKQ